ncbi:hypothetical protein ACFLQL_00650 [Verrucomicrobiota bacterium]
MNDIKYKGYTIRIEQDEQPEDPRDWSNLGIMVCFHKRYTLGDETDLNSAMFNGWEELKSHLIKKERAKFIEPLYMYDHSGITISTTPFSCPWDSGQIGFIYTTSKLIREEYGHKSIDSIRDLVSAVLASEVMIYDQYLTGDVCGYSIEKNEKDIDCCSGFYGADEAIAEAKHNIDEIIKQGENET